MKVLFVAHSFKGGGAEKCLEMLVDHCHRRGDECVVIGPGDGPDPVRLRTLCKRIVRTRLSNAHVYENHKPIANLVKLAHNVWLMRGVIRQFRPDVVYTNTTAVMSGAIAASLMRVPHVWHVHENVDTFGLRWVLPFPVMRKLILATSRKVIFVSELALRSVLPAGDEKAVVVHNGVDPAAFRERLAEITGGDEISKRIAFWGALSHRKGLDVLVRALAIVVGKRSRTTLDVWGQGTPEYVSSLKQLCSSLNIADRVTFKGFCENVAAHISEYDAVVVPSRAESFSLVALEAMAACVPVVVTRCGGPEEFVHHGVDGFVVPVDDSEALARAITEVLDCPRQASEMARRARKKVVADFNITAKLAEICRHVESTIG